MAVLKYYKLLNDNISLLQNSIVYNNNINIPHLCTLLTIGLSFHTLQAMIYTIEIYHRKQKVEISLFAPEPKSVLVVPKTYKAFDYFIYLISD